MSMPIPPPAITLPHAWAARSVGGGGRVDGQSSDIEGVFVPSVSHSTFSVTMPCALAWREKTGAVPAIFMCCTVQYCAVYCAVCCVVLCGILFNFIVFYFLIYSHRILTDT